MCCVLSALKMTNRGQASTLGFHGRSDSDPIYGRHKLVGLGLVLHRSPKTLPRHLAF